MGERKHFASTRGAQLKKRTEGYARFWVGYILVLLFAFLGVSGARAVNSDSHGSLVIATFLLNGLVGMVCLVKAATRDSFSLSIVHWVFYLLFLVLAPLFQYLSGAAIWGYDLDGELFAKGNLVLLGWAGVVQLAQSAVVRSGGENGHRQVDPEWCVSKSTIGVFVLSSMAVTLYLIRSVGFFELLSRDTNQVDTSSGSLDLVVQNVTRGIVAVTVLGCLIRRRQSGDCLPQLLLALALCAVVCSPSGMPRYATAAVWGGIAIMAIPLLSKKGVFPIVLTAAFLVLFPVINIYRRESIFSASLMGALDATLSNLFHSLLSETADSYSMFLRSWLYVDSYGITWGWQLLGVMLFFVPRTMWARKPYGSGMTVAEAQGQDFTNVSFPLPAEGMLNFGLLGVGVFALVVGLVVGRVDRLFWGDGRRKYLFLEIFYPQLLFFLFFIMRGDLMSSVAYTVSFASVVFVFTGLNSVMSGTHSRPAFAPRRGRSGVGSTDCV